MIGGLFKYFGRTPRTTNFDLVRKSLSAIYELINRIVSPVAYLDKSTAQTVATPIASENLISDFSSLTYKNVNEVVTPPSDFLPQVDEITFNRLDPSIPGPHSGSLAYGIVSQTSVLTISALDNSADTLTVSGYSASSPVPVNSGMSFTYTASGTSIGGLTSGLTYYITTVTGNSTFQISSTLGGTAINITGTLPSGTHTLTPLDIKSTLFYYDNVNNSPSIDRVKLGWPTSIGTYNKGATFADTYTGWCAGTGNVKIYTTNPYCDISFDHITITNQQTGSKDVIYGKANVPATSYNIRIVPGTPGAGSVDTGSFLTDRGYWIYVIYDPTNKVYNGLLSLSRVNPVLPTNYTYFARVGWLRSASTTGFISSLQINHFFNFLNSFPLLLTAANRTGVGKLTLIDNLLESPSLYPHREFMASVNLLYKTTSMSGSASRKSVALISANANSTNTTYFENTTYLQYRLAAVSGTYTNSDGIFNAVPMYTGLTSDEGLELQHTFGSDTVSLTVSLTGFKFKRELFIN